MAIERVENSISKLSPAGVYVIAGYLSSNRDFLVEWKSDRRAAPIVFGPCTPHGKPGRVGRTWGTRPISSDLSYDTDSAGTAEK
jgi:hypothetical protein